MFSGHRVATAALCCTFVLVCFIPVLAEPGSEPELDPGSWTISLGPPRPVPAVKLVGGRPSGCLHFKVWPSETRIYLDGRYMGTVEEYDGWPDKLFLPEGRYRLRLNGPRGLAWRGEVSVPAYHQVSVRAHRL